MVKKKSASVSWWEKQNIIHKNILHQFPLAASYSSSRSNTSCAHSLQNKSLKKPHYRSLFHLRPSCSTGLWHEAGKVDYLFRTWFLQEMKVCCCEDVGETSLWYWSGLKLFLFIYKAVFVVFSPQERWFTLFNFVIAVLVCGLYQGCC